MPDQPEQQAEGSCTASISVLLDIGLWSPMFGYRVLPWMANMYFKKKKLYFSVAFGSRDKSLKFWSPEMIGKLYNNNVAVILTGGSQVALCLSSVESYEI